VYFVNAGDLAQLNNLLRFLFLHEFEVEFERIFKNKITHMRMSNILSLNSGPIDQNALHLLIVQSFCWDHPMLLFM